MTLQENLEMQRKFALNKFPPMLQYVEQTVVEMERIYYDAGQPWGEGQAVAWISDQYDQYQTMLELESQEIQDYRKKVLQQGKEIGDVQFVGDRLVMNVKATARWLYFHLGDLLDRADTEIRGLNQAEMKSFELDLYHAVGELEFAKQQMTA